MPVLTTIRQSPAYLYVKTYCLCAIITLFQAAPISSQLPEIRQARLGKLRQPRSRILSKDVPDSVASLEHDKFSKAIFTSPRKLPPNLLKRWLRQAVDLAQIKRHLQKDDKDTKTYHELNWDAVVRHSSSPHPEEERFIQVRKTRISSQGINALHQFLDLPSNEHVDPRDVPLVALGGSGGGYRAMYSFTAFISASKKLGLWDCLTWTAGVSGSCWTLAAYYTIANHDAARLTRHFLVVARERAHPMSLHAFDTVVRSSKGVYFLLGPLVRKVRSGIIGLGIMDLYGTLTTTYQLLSREPGARLSRATFQFSKVWTRSGIDKGLEPMPIFTAVRRAPKNSSGVKPHTDSSLSKGRPPTRALTQHQTQVPTVLATIQRQTSQTKLFRPSTSRQILGEQIDSSLSKGFFQWFEITPLEVGSPDVNKYIPTWSWGRSFDSGHSVGRPPEQSLGLILGQCTSAPAGPLSGYISALLASIPKGTVMSRLLLLLNDFVRMKKWERVWGNPIRAGHDPNPFYGHNDRPRLSSKASAEHLTRESVTHFDSTPSKPASIDAKEAKPAPKPPTKKPTWENEGRIRLMDSGMSNNLPSHILARPSRATDIILAFDASSDVQSGSAIRRLQNFADDCHLTLTEETGNFSVPKARFESGEGREVEREFLGSYVRIFRGVREGGRDGGGEKEKERELWLVYCPLLPFGGNAGFDPSTASFSNSYNLIWTPEQIQLLMDTASANVSYYAIQTIREVVKRVYDGKKKRRLETYKEEQHK